MIARRNKQNVGKSSENAQVNSRTEIVWRESDILTKQRERIQYFEVFMKRIMFYEPWFFIFFGVFHLHRIWGLLDRNAYSDFWINALEHKGFFYYLIFGVLAIQSMIGIATFIKHFHDNYWWRWIYLLGGGYVLFDLLMIATEQGFWRKLLFRMFDVDFVYWNIIWLAFIVLGGASFVLGIVLLQEYRKNIYCD